LKNKGFKEERMTKVGLYAIDKSTTLESNKSHKYKNLQAQIDVLNLFNSDQHDIDYFYRSRLPGEPTDGIEDVHFHPVEPRTVRFYLTYRF
jgi:hypothetical protein